MLCASISINGTGVMALAAREHQVVPLLIACQRSASYFTRIKLSESLNYLFAGNRGTPYTYSREPRDMMPFV